MKMVITTNTFFFPVSNQLARGIAGGDSSEVIVASGRPTRRYRYATPFRTTWVSDGSSVYWVASPAIVSTGANGLPGSERNTIHCAGGWGGGLQRSAVLEPPSLGASTAPSGNANRKDGARARERASAAALAAVAVRRRAGGFSGIRSPPRARGIPGIGPNRSRRGGPHGVNRRSFETDGRRW